MRAHISNYRIYTLNVHIMKTIFDTIEADQQLSTLATAIKTAKLSETLAATGPFTIFAPTNEAFAKVAPEAFKALLADPVKLATLLKSHVISGKQNAAKLAPQKEVQSLQGTKLMIDSTDGVTINKAKVVTADVECDNGFIHTIDTVLS
jgi:uncharacterized surface protein with fasciclin (FAS1) repeats